MDDAAAYYQPPPQPPPPGVVPTYVYYRSPQQPPSPAAPLPPPIRQTYLAPHYASPGPPHDDLRTLFIAGLPDDVKPREIYNLFREFPGYESSHLRSITKKSQPFAFAVFTDQQSAVAAMHTLNGMVFDLEKGSTLFIDFAKANSRSKRSRTDDERFGLDKKARVSPAFVYPDPGLGSTHLPGMSSSSYSTIGYPPAQRVANPDGRDVNEWTATSMSAAPPCPTLFVANLGPRCTEQELLQVFSRCPGFLKLKMQSKHGKPVAFVDFKDTDCSTDALNLLQGTVLYSSPAGESMRLEYAKSRMGMRGKSKSR
ncbi:protein couch potato isoform X2 [Punica granatum]|uniref:Protein couch potato isoform X2 n=1 Tax=Punica granatum TaxID=22663 RepID=A0A218W158_PUNGR|nr:protein couch potato isoform X2 [Punica granatum]OWM66283.1 hypothetical protein CDL15_Pgr013500 [Punica granatum]